MRADLAVLMAIIGISEATLGEGHSDKQKSICKDVVIVGGGASGTYAAIRLREDFNASVVVLEPTNKLGGHVHTFYDSVSNTSIDYGVQTYIKYGPAESFFARLGIEIGPSRQDPPSVQSFVDSASGALLSDYKPPGFADMGKSLHNYFEQVKKYNSSLLPGLWNFPAPNDIPADLLLPFEDFVKKYDIQAAIPLIQVVANPGVGGFQGILTIHVMAFAFGAPVTEGLMSNSFFNAVNASNSIVYDKAYTRLKDDVLLRTTVDSATRTSNGVKLVASSADGSQTLIDAKQLLIAMPPSLSNLKPYDIDKQENDVFKTWTPTSSFVGMVKTSGLPRNHTISFISKKAIPNHYLHLWDQPYTLTFNPKGHPDERLYQFLIASNETITSDQAKAKVLEGIQLLSSAGTFNNGSDLETDKELESHILAFGDHSSVLHRQTAEQYKNGYIQDFYSLQGHRSTWYTGSVWTEDFSSTVWAFTDTILERMMK